MQTKFYQRRWTYFVSAFIFLLLGGLTLSVGIAMANGMEGADGRKRVDVAPYPITMGCLALLLAAFFIVQIVLRSRPIVVATPDQLVIRMIGMNLPRLSLPRRLRLLGAFIRIGDPRTYRTTEILVPWQSIRRIEVLGAPMNRFLRIIVRDGSAIDLGSFFFADRVDHVAQTLNTLLRA